jgi:DNA-binding CsgD family transcriptional regulator
VAEEVVGRGVELAAAEELLERAGTSMAALLLEGEAGIGKTTIWEACVDGARSRGWLVLAAQPARAEQGLTLGGLTDLLGATSDDDMARLPQPQRHALEVALLRVEPTGALPDQRALSVAVAGLLRGLARHDRPVLLAVDDAQWLDESSAAILAHAVRRLADRPIGVLLAIRTGTSTQASDALADAAPPDRLERVHVGPLPLGSLHRLLETRLERSFPRLVLVQIEATSGGNPLFAIEIARALVTSGAPVLPGQPLPVPSSLGPLIAQRIAGMPGQTRAALLLAAAATEPTVETLRSAGADDEALVPAVADGIVSLDGDLVRFAHPLLVQAVLTHAQPAELRAAHVSLAAASPTTDARARHRGLAAVAPDEAVALELDVAAAGARRRGATLDAAALYRDAARLTPPTAPGPRLGRSVLAAECLFVDLSEIVQADAILAAALADDAATGPVRADALSLRALIRYYHGRVTEAVDLGRQAIAAAGRDPVARARVLARVAFVTMQLDLERGVAMADEAVRLLDHVPGEVGPDLLANALLLRAVGELGLVRPTRAGDVERGLRLMTSYGRSWEHEGADGSAFGIARLTDDLDRAIELTRELIRAKSGPAGDDPFNLVMLSGLLVYRGEWAEARRIAEAALDGYAREGEDVHPAWGLRGLALVAAHDGRLEDARRWAGEGMRSAGDRGDVIVEAFHHQILGFVALSTEAWPEADAHLTRAAVLADLAGARHPGRVKVAGDQLEAALALGDTDRAAAVQARLDEAGRLAPTPWVVAVGARCAGLLAAARGDLDGAAEALDRALGAHDRLPMPFERGRTLLAKGRLHRRRREKRLADETLRAALAVFEGLGSPVWAGRARAELGRVGLRPRAAEGLTETELRVAELAASGLSNRRIAERAFLAPKTVGNVLGRVYEKLGIHSRAELGALMASATPPNGSGEPEGGRAAASQGGAPDRR